MIYRIAGGIFFILLGLSYLGITAIPFVVIGIIALVAGIALIAGQ